MNLPELSIRRPVTVFMAILIVLLFGLVSMTKLPVELYPNTSFGEISIVINIRGGIPPTEVESQVTRIVEEAVASVSNLQQLMSISKEGESTVVMTFQPDTNMDFAALEVREKFSKVKNLLPKEIEKPVIAQFQQNDVPVVIVSAISEVRSTEDIRKIVDETMKEDLKRVAGVANVEVAGGRARKILIEADRTRLAAFGIPLDEVTSVISANNLNLLSGEIDREKDRFLVRIIGEYKEVEFIKQLPLRITQQGSIIRVRDVAIVKDGFMEANEYARLNARPVVTVYVQKESSKNTITVAKEVLKQFDLLKVKLPKDIRLVVTSNQADFIQNAIDNLGESLLKGVVLIILVFFLFLYRFARREMMLILGLILATLMLKGYFIHGILVGLLCVLIFIKKYRPIIIVTTPIPVSVIGAFILMRSMGLTINVMTLFGLALGVGMLIDNSIVVFENILKKVEQGQEPVRAADEGASEMLLTLIASNATNIIVFLPLLFMGDELQRMYSGMAATIVISLLISILSALTIVPMMSARPAFSMGSVVGSGEETGDSALK
ncbi:MAG: efflux RND transporter permease subunit, partial [Candidatus Omnitrophota bacterium]